MNSPDVNDRTQFCVRLSGVDGVRKIAHYAGVDFTLIEALLRLLGEFERQELNSVMLERQEAERMGQLH